MGCSLVSSFWLLISVVSAAENSMSYYLATIIELFMLYQDKIMGDVLMEEKNIKLDMRLAFNEKMVEDLNSVIIRQQNQIDELINDVAILKKEFKQIIQGLPEENEDEQVPPHY